MDYGRFAVELKSTGKFIGFAGLKYLPELDEVDLGYRFIKAEWGKGYATEAAKACIDFGFNQLKLSSIIALTLPENTASIRVPEKLNFEYIDTYIEDGLLAHKYALTKQYHNS